MGPTRGHPGCVVMCLYVSYYRAVPYQPLYIPCVKIRLLARALSFYLLSTDSDAWAIFVIRNPVSPRLAPLDRPLPGDDGMSSGTTTVGGGGAGRRRARRFDRVLHSKLSAVSVAVFS